MPFLRFGGRLIRSKTTTARTLLSQTYCFTTGSSELPEGILYRAMDMAEKWDADFFDGKIYFSRSWTGDLVLVADVTMQSRALAISAVTSPSIDAEPSPMPIRDVDFLVKTYILRGEVPHCGYRV